MKQFIAATPAFARLFALLCALLALQAPLQAAEDPQAKLKAAIDDILNILDEEKDIQNVQRLKDRLLEAMEGRFSFEVIVRRALGRHWNRLDTEQQEEVEDLLIRLILASYANEMGSDPDIKVTVGEAAKLTEHKVEVPSEATYNGRTVKMTYRMARLRSGWEVYDVLVEGISLVNNYRKQFDEHFRRKSAEDLIEVLRTKLENERGTEEDKEA